MALSQHRLLSLPLLRAELVLSSLRYPVSVIEVGCKGRKMSPFRLS